MSRATQGPATLRMASCTGRSPAMARCSNLFHSPCFLRSRGPTTPCVPEHAWFGLFPVRSPLLGESLLFSLPAGTKMFQFPAFACRISGMTGLQPAGLSHSDILGSKVICTSPGLFAAYHVLLRLQEPRHPPYALSYLLTRHILLRAVSAESCTLRFSCFLNLYGFTFIAFICSYSFEIALEESFVLSNMSKIMCNDFVAIGGEYRIRTDDPLLAKQVL